MNFRPRTPVECGPWIVDVTILWTFCSVPKLDLEPKWQIPRDVLGSTHFFTIFSTVSAVVDEHDLAILGQQLLRYFAAASHYQSPFSFGGQFTQKIRKIVHLI